MNLKTKSLIILSVFIISLSFMGATFAADNATVTLEADNINNIGLDDTNNILNSSTDDIIGDDEPSDELVANFRNDENEGKDSVTVKFTDNSSGNITNYFWDFGDGTNSTVKNPTHTYYKYGFFDVKLTVSNNSTSNTITKSKLIEVYSSNAIISDDWTRINAFDDWGVYEIMSTGSISQNINFDVINAISFKMYLSYGPSKSGKVYVYIDDEVVAEEDVSKSESQVEVKVSDYSGKHTLKISPTMATLYDMVSISDINAEIDDGIMFADLDFASTKINGNNISVTFNDNSIGKFNTWFWDFGDNTNSTDKNPTHVYTTPGKYNVTLKVSYNDDTKECTKQYVFSDLSIDFDVRVSEGENSTFSTKINSTTSGIIGSYLWDFGDGNTSTEENPTHSYADEGKYTITLTVSNDIKRVSLSKTVYITLNNTLISNFTSNVNSGKDTVTVQFTDASEGNIASWFWDFGDGTNSTLQNPTHTYTTFGKYDVTLTVSNGVGSANATKKENYIIVYAENNIFINPSFELGETGWEMMDISTTAYKGLENYFVKDGSKAVVIYKDGYISQIINFDTVDSFTFYAKTYNLNGHSGASLLVYLDDIEMANITGLGSYRSAFNEISVNTSGYTGVHRLKIVVSSSLPAVVDYFTATYNDKDSSNLAVDSYTENEGEITVNFADRSGGKIVYWYWDFGDGTNSTDKNPTHTYSQLGKYNVTLNVTGTDGSVISTTKLMTFGSLNNVTFTNDKNTGYKNLTVQFNASTDQEADEWFWDFGDGTFSSQQNPVHTYTKIGNFDVTVTASNAIITVSQTKEKLIIISDDLVSNFTTNVVNSTFVNTPVDFTDSSEGNPSTFLWDFGDGSFSNLQNPQHSYTTAGIYNVTLTVSSKFNQTNIQN